jgi:hypothetical protein
VPPREKTVSDMGPDKARAAGDQDFHENLRQD